MTKFVCNIFFVHARVCQSPKGTKQAYNYLDIIYIISKSLRTTFIIATLLQSLSTALIIILIHFSLFRACLGSAYFAKTEKSILVHFSPFRLQDLLVNN